MGVVRRENYPQISQIYADFLGKGVSRGDAEGTEINVLDYIGGLRDYVGTGLTRFLRLTGREICSC